jgi:hypothetical protein
MHHGWKKAYTKPHGLKREEILKQTDGRVETKSGQKKNTV